MERAEERFEGLPSAPTTPVGPIQADGLNWFIIEDHILEAGGYQLRDVIETVRVYGVREFYVNFPVQLLAELGELFDAPDGTAIYAGEVVFRKFDRYGDEPFADRVYVNKLRNVTGSANQYWNDAYEYSYISKDSWRALCAAWGWTPPD